MGIGKGISFLDNARLGTPASHKVKTPDYLAKVIKVKTIIISYH